MHSQEQEFGRFCVFQRLERRPSGWRLSTLHKGWVFASLALTIISGICGAESLPVQKVAKLDQVVSRYQECGFLNGAVLVAEHGKVLYEKGIGEANMEMHTPNTPQTKFGIASITKQFTAVLVLQMAAKGKLRLDGTVSEYLLGTAKTQGRALRSSNCCIIRLGSRPIMTAQSFRTPQKPAASTSLRSSRKSFVSQT